MTPEQLRQIEELYHSARESTPAEREALLQHADPEVRRQVEELVAQDASGNRLLDQSLGELVDELLKDSGLRTVPAGLQLGPYQIETLLGTGGMGKVYRALDTRLDRKVAIKISREQFSERFEREARAISALNHPHICTLYDVGPNYLVMELVEGETLAAKLKKGKLSIDETLRYGGQIAAALAEAHSKGITHRDLKPGNVMIAKNGVKVLDFGLAKSAGEETLTTSNAVMGTPAYMAPEQQEGQACDARTDIYALGLVLREMATGHRDGTTLELPAQLAHVVERCIAKDPEDRWQAASDVRKELEWSAVVQAPSLPAVTRRATRSLAPLGWIAACVLALALGVLSFIYFRQTLQAQHVLHSIIALPENTTVLQSFAISPDGRLLAMAAQVNDKRQLWLRALDDPQAQAMQGTDDAAYPFWSPDSRYIGFFAQGKLKKIVASGGPAQTLADAPGGQGGSWNRDNVILFCLNGGRIPIQRVSAGGGAPADATSRKGLSRFPQFLPDGRHFLYMIGGLSVDERGIYLASLDGKESRRILPDLSSVVFAAGRLLFVRENSLMAQPFDAASGQLRGEAVPVAEGVVKALINYARFTVSESGVLVYQRGGAIFNQIGWYGRDGKLLEALGAPGFVWDAAISPDEKWVAFRGSRGLGTGLWVRDLTRGAEQLITDAPAVSGPAWSPQGEQIAFDSSRADGISNLYQKAVGGTGQGELLLANGNNKWTSQWSRDGRFIVYTEADPKTKLDIWVLPMGAAEHKPIPFLRSVSNELLGQLSPDSHWMAYTSDESGQREVYVRPFPAGEGQWKISIGGGDQPRWRGDGGELFFVATNSEYSGGIGIDSMMAVTVKAKASPDPANKPSFEAGVPHLLFETRLARATANDVLEYDVTADGKRFLLATSDVSAASESQLNVVSNWNAGLKK